MAQEDLTLRVGVKNTASKGFKQVTEDVKRFTNEFKNATPRVEGTTASVLRFATGVAVGNLAVLAARKGLQMLNEEFRKTIDAFNQTQSAAIGLSSVASAFGQDADMATEAAKKLASDGLIPLKDTSSALKNLLATGFNLEESIKLFNGLKDSAAFNRQGMLEWGESIVGATEGLKNQNSIMVDNAGVTKNLSVILKEAGYSQQDLMRVSSDAGVRQALLNGILRETAIFEGDAALKADTLSGAQSKLATSAFNLRATIGSSLAPALTLLTKHFGNLVEKLTNNVNPSVNTLAKSLTFLTGVFNALVTTLIRGGQLIINTFKAMVHAEQAFFKAMTGDIRGAMDSLGDAVIDMKAPFVGWFNDMKDISRDTFQAIDQINTQGLKSFEKNIRESIENISDATKKAMEDLQKEMDNFNRSMAKSQRDFEQNLKDMVIAHRDKTNQIKSDITEESDRFKESLEDRKEVFDEAMKDIEERHSEKTASLKDNIEDEYQKIKSTTEKIKDSHKEEVAQFQKGMQERLISLQVQLDREKGKGQFASKKKIEDLEKMLQRERDSILEQTDLKDQIIEDEIKRETEANREKINDLNTSLDEENSAVILARNKKESEYEKETAKITSEYNKRLSVLQEQLNIEIDIQKKYANDFMSFKNAVAEDDIARLKRKYAEERAELERQHQEKLADIAKRVNEERTTAAAAAVRTTGNVQQYNQQIQSAAQQVAQTTQKVQQSINYTPTSRNIPATPVSSNVPFTRGTSNSGSSGGGIISSITNFVSKAFSGIKGFFGFAEGGIVDRPTFSMIGEDGPEVVLPLSKPSRMRELMSQAGISGGGGQKNVTINMPITVASSEVDIDDIISRLQYKMKTSGII